EFQRIAAVVHDVRFLVLVLPVVLRVQVRPAGEKEAVEACHQIAKEAFIDVRWHRQRLRQPARRKDRIRIGRVDISAELPTLAAGCINAARNADHRPHEYSSVKRVAEHATFCNRLGSAANCTRSTTFRCARQTSKGSSAEAYVCWQELAIAGR